MQSVKPRISQKLNKLIEHPIFIDDKSISLVTHYFDEHEDDYMNHDNSYKTSNTTVEKIGFTTTSSTNKN